MPQDDSCRLNCLIEGESIVFVVTVRRSSVVGELKEDVQREGASLKDVHPYTLELWKVSTIDDL